MMVCGGMLMILLKRIKPAQPFNIEASKNHSDVG